jgi:hypothetical protein
VEFELRKQVWMKPTKKWYGVVIDEREWNASVVAAVVAVVAVVVRKV